MIGICCTYFPNWHCYRNLEYQGGRRKPTWWKSRHDVLVRASSTEARSIRRMSTWGQKECWGQNGLPLTCVACSLTTLGDFQALPIHAVRPKNPGLVREEFAFLSTNTTSSTSTLHWRARRRKRRSRPQMTSSNILCMLAVAYRQPHRT
jgi:hypothetical protein